MRILTATALLSLALAAGTAGASSHREAPNPTGNRGRVAQEPSALQVVVAWLFSDDSQPAPARDGTLTVKRPGYTVATPTTTR